MSVKIPAGMAFSEKDCQAILKQLIDRYEQGSDGNVGAFPKLRVRRDHFFNHPRHDPSLGPYISGPKWQSNDLRETWVKMVTRLTENEWSVSGKPMIPTATQERRTTDVEMFFMSGIRNGEQRQDINLQRLLADRVVREGRAWLHARPLKDMCPPLPDAVILDSVPGVGEQGKYRKKRQEADKDGKYGYRYEEILESRERRQVEDGAKAGWPWFMAVAPAGAVMEVKDELGLALLVWVKQVGVLDYSKRLKDRDKIVLSVNQVDKKVQIFVEGEAPAGRGEGSWGEMVGIAEIWTRTEYYELATDSAFVNADMLAISGWQLVKAFPHEYEEVPWWKCAALEADDPDPANQISGPLDGVYKQKPFFDFTVAMMHLLLHSAAEPVWWYEHTVTGLPRLNEQGEPLYMTGAAAAAQEVPEGYTLKQYAPEFPEAIVKSMEFQRQEMEDAKPATGRAEAPPGRVPEPWGMRMLQADNSIEPSNYSDAIRDTLTKMVRFMAKIHSKGVLGTVATFVRDGDKRKMIVLAPEDVESLDLEAQIPTESAAEKITLQQHGIAMYRDGVPGITAEVLIEKYLGIENPQDFFHRWLADQSFNADVWPGMSKRIVAEEFGHQVFLGPDGVMLNAQGLALELGKTAADNGVTAVPQPGLEPGMPPNGAAAMPPSGPMTVPGTLPVAGPGA